MYYRLKEPWTFCGWKKTPHAVRAVGGQHKHDNPFFLEKDVFLELLSCNGEEDVDASELSEKTQRIIKEFSDHDIMEQSEEKMPPLQSWQRYHVFPSRFVENVHWSITGKCNFNCRHCLVSAPDAHHPQLPLSDCIHIIHEIASCGIMAVDVTGGEPLVRSDFEEIVKELTHCNIDIRLIFTNASLLTGETLDMLEKYHQHPAFQLSFDGLGHHDWLRGVQGAEKQADTAFRLLQERGYAVAAAMCIHKGNKDSLRDTIKYLAGYGVMSLRLNAPQNLGVWKQYSEEYAMSEDEVWKVYRDNIEWYFEDGMPIDLELDGYFSCRKGKTNYRIPYVHHPPENVDWSKVPQCESMRHHIYIGPEGRLAPCMGFSDTEMGAKFPSVLEEHLGKLTLDANLYSDVVNTRASDFRKANPECAECEHFRECGGGCMAEGMAQCGNYLAKDERACNFHKNIGEKAVREAADNAIKKFGREVPEEDKQGDPETILGAKC